MNGEPDETDPFRDERRRMVEEQLCSRGVRDPRVLAAMAEVPRHRFVPDGQLHRAYGDHPLAIGAGQTISQPYMVARMTELCAPGEGEHALEVGAGCGYQSAVLARLCRQVHAAEIIEELAQRAGETLAALGCANVVVEHRDGSGGWPEQAPFDMILVAAGAPEVPAALLEQLAEGGRLVIPVGGRDVQVLRCLTRRGAEWGRVEDTPCRFVDLRGRYGWDDVRFS